MNLNSMPLADCTDLCPHLERGDARCNPHLKLGHLDEAFSNCCGNFRACAAWESIEGSPSAQRANPFSSIGFGSDLRVVAVAAAVVVAVAGEARPIQVGAQGGSPSEFHHWTPELPDAPAS